MFVLFVVCLNDTRGRRFVTEHGGDRNFCPQNRIFFQFVYPVMRILPNDSCLVCRYLRIMLLYHCIVSS